MWGKYMEQRLLREVLPWVVQPRRSTGTQAGDCQPFPITIQPLWVALEMQLMKVPPPCFTGTRSKPPGHTEPAAAELRVAWGHIQDLQAAPSHPCSKPTLLRLLLTPLQFHFSTGGRQLRRVVKQIPVTSWKIICL